MTKGSTLLHDLLLEYEEKSVNEFRPVSAEIDFSDMLKVAVETVQNKQFFEALFALALLGAPRKISELEKQVEQNTRNYPLSHLLSSVGVNGTGKVISRRPSMLSNTQEEIDAARKAEMHSLAAQYQSIHAIGLIDPARHRLNLEHNVRIADFLELTSNNPFVPPGRELQFARGLYAGMTGDYLVAAHLLVPQLENSLRYILNQRGIRTSGLDSEGIQEEFLLDKILYMPELAQILGDDLVFTLKGLLVEKHGSNFRNLLSHGLLYHDQFYSGQSIYLWWLVLRFCCIPILTKLKEMENGSEEQAS